MCPKVSFFFKKLFLDFPELRLGTVGTQADIPILSFFYIYIYIHNKKVVKKVFIKLFQNSQENTCARLSFFNKVAGLSPVL